MLFRKSPDVSTQSPPLTALRIDGCRRQPQHPGDGAVLACSGQCNSVPKVTVCTQLPGDCDGPGNSCVSSGGWNHLVLTPWSPWLALVQPFLWSGDPAAWQSCSTTVRDQDLGIKNLGTSMKNPSWAFGLALLAVLCFPVVFSWRIAREERIYSFCMMYTSRQRYVGILFSIPALLQSLCSSVWLNFTIVLTYTRYFVRFEKKPHEF